MRLLLEGPAIEPLLARVREEHGSTARIVHAERIRSGGFAGFFVKERFEVTIEVDDAPTPTLLTPAPTLSRDHAEVARPTASALAPSPLTPSRDHAEVAQAAGGLDALIAAAEREERGEPSAALHLSTESAAFAEVLSSLHALRDGASRPATTPTTPPTPATPLRDHAEVARAGAVPTAPEQVLRDRAGVGETKPQPTGQVLHDHAGVGETKPQPTEQVLHDHAGGEARGRRVPSFKDRVVRTGLPVHLLDDLEDDGGPAELLDVLRTLPRAPKVLARAGYLVAVVGERREALATGRRIADRLKLDPADVLFAGRPRQDDAPASEEPGDVVTSVDQARRASAAVRMGEVPAVVVVEAGYDKDELDWAVQLLRALSPDQVIACVDATRKTADTAAWIAGWARPGVQVDALSVHRAAATTDPGSVLALAHPVLEVDGQDGAATTWLAVLLDRAQPPRAATRRRSTTRRAGTKPAGKNARNATSNKTSASKGTAAPDTTHASPSRADNGVKL